MPKDSFAFHPSVAIVHETDHYAIVNKPALLDCQNSKESRHSLVDWLKEQYGYAGLVHRLDFGTSGVMVCAKDPKSAQHLTHLFKKGMINKKYLSLCIGKILPLKGNIDYPLDDKPALTEYEVLEHYANASLVLVTLHTGRKHQIRRHLAEMGHPLLGDVLYKKKGSHLLFSRPALHSFSISFENKTFQVDPPEDWQELLQKLRCSGS